MIIREEILSSGRAASIQNALPESDWKKAIFFDIETTGLGWRSSHIYLIGVLYCEKDVWKLKQWFLDRPFAEKELLESFSSFLRERDAAFLADYNGDTFDIPYLRNKFSFYELALPAPLRTEGSCQNAHRDLLRLLRPLKSRLPLSSLRLQEVERLLGTDREDSASGKELIEVYYRYLQTGGEELLDSLFLHNHDDVLGLPPVVSLLQYSDFWKGEFSVQEFSVQKLSVQEVCFTGDEPARVSCILKLHTPVPLAFTLQGQLPQFGRENAVDSALRDPGVCTLAFQKDSARLTVPFLEGECRLFFPDPKNYYYLPNEDQAVHKSVGAYVNPAFRMQAKAANCYRRVSGRFLPLPEKRLPARAEATLSGLPRFYRVYRDKLCWIRADDLLNADDSVRHAYAETLLSLF